MASPKKSVLFICLGNICRSPIAEAVFVQLLKDAGQESEWKVDSAAIGNWHVGKKPDQRALSVLSRHGISTPHRARQIKKSDFLEFDYIFGMDDDNMEDLKSMTPDNCKASVELLGDYDPEEVRLIRDPYYDRGEQGFEDCYVQCMRCCKAFLEKTI